MELPLTPRNPTLKQVAQQATSQLSPSPSPAPTVRSLSDSPSPSPALRQSRVAIKWSDEMELALVEALAAAVVRGHRADSGYKKDAWDTAVKEVSLVAGFTIIEQQCKNKHNALKKDYKTWVELKSQSGFELGPHGLVDADRGALKAYFAAHKDARKFQHKTLQHEELLHTLFEGVLATGDGAMSIDDAIGGVSSSDEIKPSTEEESTPSCVDLTDETAPPRKRAGTASLVRIRKSKKSTASDRLGDKLVGISTQIESLAAAVRDDPQQRALSILTDSFKILPFELSYVVSVTFSDIFIAKYFISLQPVFRKKWVHKELLKHRNELSNELYDGRSFDQLVKSIIWDGDRELELREIVLVD
ncbi:hypothetical protein GQ44DRAFT_756533 [Phaeosphaeriaceae sp. PMI808]|nr:hypothetical protein GQ44DRAFT_756533 [Phaeosphaeriaceae sp. PMI808]